MREEMYVPGQDDFPGWDEFYSGRNAPRSRLRYSIKTLMLIPPIVAIVCLAYDRGWHAGNWDEQKLNADRRQESLARQTAEVVAVKNANSAAAADNAAKQADEQARLAMKTLTGLLEEIEDSPNQDLESKQSAALRLLAFDGLKTAATSLTTAANDTTAKRSKESEHIFIVRHLDLARSFLLLRTANDNALSEAQKQLEAAQEAARGVLHLNSADKAARQDVILAETAAGDFYRQSGRLPSAVDAYRNAVENGEILHRDEPLSPKLARDLAFYESNLADAMLQIGNPVGARDYYQAACEIVEKLVKDDPKSEAFRHDLALLDGKRGDAFLESDGIAVAADEPAVEFGLFPNRLSAAGAAIRLNRYVIYERIEDGNRRAANMIAARTAYQTSLAALRRIAKDHPQDRLAQEELAHALGRCGYHQIAVEDFPAAKKSLDKALAILRPFENAKPSPDLPAVRRWLKDLNEKSALCDKSLRAVGDLQFVVNSPEKDIPRLLALRGRVLARFGRLADATETANRLAALEPPSAERIFATAEIFALCAAAPVEPADAAPGDRAAVPTDDSSVTKALRQQAIASAIVNLRRAADLGYWKNIESMADLLANQNLAALSRQEGYVKLIESLDAAVAERAKNRK